MKYPEDSTEQDQSPAFRPPTYTQVPNEFLDEIMPQITTLAELKVTQAIIRQTFGWHKREDQLSLARLEDLTGLTRKSVTEGIKDALGRGYVGRRKVRQGYVYGLRVDSTYVDSTYPAPTSEVSTLVDAETSEVSTPLTSVDTIPTKERVKERERDKEIVVEEKDEGSVESLPDDVTARCLLLLKSLKGFPRDQGENAVKLAEWRDEFPRVEPVEVVRDFKAYCEETKKPATRIRLRNFFKQANKFSAANDLYHPTEKARRESASLTGVTPEERAAQVARAKEGYEWLFEGDAEARKRQEEIRRQIDGSKDGRATLLAAMRGEDSEGEEE